MSSNLWINVTVFHAVGEAGYSLLQMIPSESDICLWESTSRRLYEVYGIELWRNHLCKEEIFDNPGILVSSRWQDKKNLLQTYWSPFRLPYLLLCCVFWCIPRSLVLLFYLFLFLFCQISSNFRLNDLPVMRGYRLISGNAPSFQSKLKGCYIFFAFSHGKKLHISPQTNGFL